MSQDQLLGGGKTRLNDVNTYKLHMAIDYHAHEIPACAATGEQGKDSKCEVPVESSLKVLRIDLGKIHEVA